MNRLFICLAAAMLFVACEKETGVVYSCVPQTQVVAQQVETAVATTVPQPIPLPEQVTPAHAYMSCFSGERLLYQGMMNLHEANCGANGYCPIKDLKSGRTIYIRANCVWTDFDPAVVPVESLHINDKPLQ